MVKYRLLSSEELNLLEKEFVLFLAAQSITADDWVRIKETDKTKETELIENFSDVVIEKTLFNAKYLEQRTDKRLLCYKVVSDQILLNGIEVDSNTTFDFTKEFALSELVALFEDTDAHVSFLSGNKPAENIKKQVFELIEDGAMISPSDDLYQFIDTLKDHFMED